MSCLLCNLALFSFALEIFEPQPPVLVGHTAGQRLLRVDVMKLRLFEASALLHNCNCDIKERRLLSTRDHTFQR